MDIRGINDSGRSAVGFEMKSTGDQSSKEEKNTKTVTANVSEKKYSKQEIEKEIDSLNEFLKGSSTHLKFQLHEKLGEYYVQVVNDHSDEVIREIPSKKILDMVAQMYEMVGILVDEKR